MEGKREGNQFAYIIPSLLLCALRWLIIHMKTAVGCVAQFLVYA
jgi:hypothetical protein